MHEEEEEAEDKTIPFIDDDELFRRYRNILGVSMIVILLASVVLTSALIVMRGRANLMV